MKKYIPHAIYGVVIGSILLLGVNILQTNLKAIQGQADVLKLRGDLCITTV